MYGTARLSNIKTTCSYLGIMQGEIFINGILEKRPFVYFTPQDIITSNGWNSPTGCSRTNYYIECTGKRVERIFAAFNAIQTPQFYPVADPAPYLAKLNEIARFFTTGTLQSHIRQILCIEEFISILEQELYTPDDAIYSKYGIDTLVEKINTAPGTLYSWKKEAAAAGITLRHWNRLFTNFTGLPPGEYQADRRMKLARKLLSSGELPIKIIAMHCGYEHPSDFIRFFKKHAGISPGSFRCRRLL